ncbi:saccharopine dehydrogenase NADP-binding domain-containing protein [Caldibacillus thermolactis]|uniref:Saccharopine dehydrogenase NADP-binding domain-containing protein n=1 Tax=Pallidibacillus thermolactis TaxID=251051 RepID=A0ABT2WEB0_9BACI|nr:saccharopine dehydrogenase C-terminal domain-containing protein [Pallidibacillus thermolactis]MCU9593989.1 saccharopine dehydrogenase NADP-binding domain-containing protein [Pallidibacillus thermolactis]MCU9600772.1 saccharopine dehydrogenase NADP-binding domain-containing protein [Pallidibacillus thermolactis subsp. kokeshiiformis]MED1674834.1 saccharopine dehydrogenase C-terminal domain-containing protein [Pallidibacillus thermolactis subsp. kokeshiiformis]
MKIGVLGAGLMGKEAARDLSKSSGVTFVGIADVNYGRAKKAELEIGSDKVKAFKVNADNEEELENYMKQFDCIINALFYSFNVKVAKTAIKVGVHSVDLGGHIGHITDEVLKLEEKAKAANVTIIPDLGVAPGMINILSGYGVSKLSKVKSIKLYVGGIPLRPEPPLEYNHVFSMEGLFDHYTDPALIIRNGKLMEVPSLSEVEPIYFEKFGPLEAFHTSGGTSTLSKSYPELETLEYKTIRYPGHAEKAKLLVDLNLTRNDYFVEIDGMKVNPRKVLLKVLDPIVELKDKEDVTLLRVIVSGLKDIKEVSYTYEMICYKNNKENVTAMARSTAYTISVVAQMIAKGVINKRGVFPPEQVVPGQTYIEEMEKRGVMITEKISE